MVTCFWDTVHVKQLLLENEFFEPRMYFMLPWLEWWGWVFWKSLIRLAV